MKRIKDKKTLTGFKVRISLLLVGLALTFVAQHNYMFFISHMGLSNLNVFSLLITFIRAFIIIWLIAELIINGVRRYRHIKNALIKGGGIDNKTYWWERRSIRLAMLVIIYAISIQLEHNPELNPIGSLIVVIIAACVLWFWVELIFGFANLVKRLLAKRKKKA
jgi:hypothetical protein